MTKCGCKEKHKPPLQNLEGRVKKLGAGGGDWQRGGHGLGNKGVKLGFTIMSNEGKEEILAWRTENMSSRQITRRKG